MQIAYLLRRVILSSVARPILPCIFTVSHKWHYFRKKLMNIKCVFWFSLKLLSEIFFILNRIHRDIIINISRPSCKNTRCSYQILMKFEDSRHIFKKSWNINFHEYPPSRSRVLPSGRTGGQWDWTKLIVAFRNSANAPEYLSFFLVALQGLHN